MDVNSNRAGLFVALTLLLAGVLLYVFRPAPVPDGLVLKRASYGELPGWTSDSQSQALVAFQKSCDRFATLPGTRSLGAGGIAGTVADWQQPCLVGRTLPPGDDAGARLFFETRFTPYQAFNRDQAAGLFTGYYEPSLRGSLIKSPVYHTPLHTRPAELVTVELGNFRNDLAGRRVAGRLQGNRLVPFPERKQIVAGKLGEKDTALVWVDDAIDAFFLQIQGSGRVALEGGDEMRVGYAATNGQPYTAIGRDLIRRGALTRENVSLQTIRAWLKDNPAEAADVMALNKSYVFFRKLSEGGPIGAQSVVLTPERSLAVDRKYIPLGVPVWLNATAPAEDPSVKDWKLQRLMVTQDTGGAIRGPVRGDVFWGYGHRAEQIAGRMKNTGGYFLLLPKSVARRIETAGEK